MSVYRAVEAGEPAGIPVMVDFGHFRAERPYYKLVTERLRPGDISTRMSADLFRTWMAAASFSLTSRRPVRAVCSSTSVTERQLRVSQRSAGRPARVLSRHDLDRSPTCTCQDLSSGHSVLPCWLPQPAAGADDAERRPRKPRQNGTAQRVAVPVSAANNQRESRLTDEFADPRRLLQANAGNFD